MSKKNELGQPLWLKKLVFQIMGSLTRKRLIGFNNLKITGSDVLLNLPDKQVLFISNHQTIFTDVIAMYHAFFATLSDQVDSIEKKGYLKKPKLNIYFVAAQETMNKGLLPKIFKMAGAVTVNRTWKQGEELIKREVNPDETKTIGKAINSGWVVTFPTGTTSKGAPVRKGAAYIIKQYRPVVVPVKVDGFREAFDKTGLKVRKKNVNLTVDFGEPLDIDFNQVSIEDLVVKIQDSISAN